MEKWRKWFENKLERLKKVDFNEKIVLDYLKLKQSKNVSYHRQYLATTISN